MGTKSNNSRHKRYNDCRGYFWLCSKVLMSIKTSNLKLKVFLNSHPNIWKFIIKIKDEETNIALKYSHLKNGTLKYKSRNSKSMENDIKILDLKNQFALKNLTVKELIFELTKTCKDFSKK